jgi:hypothetical protein
MGLKLSAVAGAVSGARVGPSAHRRHTNEEKAFIVSVLLSGIKKKPKKKREEEPVHRHSAICGKNAKALERAGRSQGTVETTYLAALVHSRDVSQIILDGRAWYQGSPRFVDYRLTAETEVEN